VNNKNVFYYLSHSKYNSVLNVLREKYNTINSYYKIKINRIFNENVNRIWSYDIIEYIGSFMYYPSNYLCAFESR
jgi:hypothetical protein